MSRSVATCFCYGENTGAWCAVSCGHVFHRNCLDVWLKDKRGGKRMCPNCKAVISERDGIRPLFLDKDDSDQAATAACPSAETEHLWKALRGSLSRLEEEKEELETQREAVLSELQSAYAKLDTTAESKEKYKRSYLDAKERLVQLQKSQEAANATHARAVEQHEISKATYEDKLRRAERLLKHALFREKVCKHLTQQQLHTLLLETLGADSASAQEDLGELLHSLALVLGERNEEVARQREAVGKLQKELEGVRAEQGAREARMLREHQKELRRKEEQLQGAKRREIELEYTLSRISGMGGQREADAARALAQAAQAPRPGPEGLEVADPEVEQGTQLSSSSLIDRLDEEDEEPAGPGPASQDTQPGSCPPAAQHHAAAPPQAQQHAASSCWEADENEPPDIPPLHNATLLRGPTATRAAAASFVGKVPAARVPPLTSNTLLRNGPYGNTMSVMPSLYSSGSNLTKRAANPSAGAGRPAVRPKLGAAGRSMSSAGQIGIKSFFKASK